MARIIVIDDDSTTLMMARAMLEAQGHEVIAASNGAEGVDAFLQHDPDLVLTDIFMPRQDGLETLRRLKSLDPEAKVVCMSSGPNRFSDASDVRDTMLRFAREFGADACITKPLSPDEVRGVIDMVLHRTSSAA